MERGGAVVCKQFWGVFVVVERVLRVWSLCAMVPGGTGEDGETCW
jgi:hypothetical protein